jgi:hypothetical protein
MITDTKYASSSEPTKTTTKIDITHVPEGMAAEIITSSEVTIIPETLILKDLTDQSIGENQAKGSSSSSELTTLSVTRGPMGFHDIIDLPGNFKITVSNDKDELLKESNTVPSAKIIEDTISTNIKETSSSTFALNHDVIGKATTLNQDLITELNGLDQEVFTDRNDNATFTTVSETNTAAAVTFESTFTGLSITPGLSKSDSKTMETTTSSYTNNLEETTSLKTVMLDLSQAEVTGTPRTQLEQRGTEKEKDIDTGFYTSVPILASELSSISPNTISREETQATMNELNIPEGISGKHHKKN